MAKLPKKLKEEKVNEITKIKKLCEKYDTIVFVENTDIQNIFQRFFHLQPMFS